MCEKFTIVGFDVPHSSEHNCAISFVLPAPVPDGYPNTVTGSGKLDVYGFNGQVINGVTNWNNRPPRYPPSTPFWTIVVWFLFSFSCLSLSGLVIAVNSGDSNQRISDPLMLPVVRCLVIMGREWTLRLLRLGVLVRLILIGLVGCLPLFLHPPFFLASCMNNC